MIKNLGNVYWGCCETPGFGKASKLEANLHTFSEHFIIVFKCILHDRFETVKLVHEFLKRNGLITEGKQ